ncbi:MAG: hypothetical protein KC423_05785 [Anaerolineales bacterium]|nr:hypothetical protein [Anaerolineales bacterium]
MANQNKLTFEQLAAWAEGTLSKTETAVIDHQLTQADPDTQATAAWLQTFFRTSREISLPTPPAELRQTLKQRFAAYAQEKRPLSFWQHLLANLTFDSYAQPSLAAARAAVESGTRQLLYTSNLADIALTIQPGQEPFTLSGQIFSPDLDNLATFVVELHQNEQTLTFTVANDLGEFNFNDLHDGVYTLVIGNDLGEMQLPPFRLQAS